MVSTQLLMTDLLKSPLAARYVSDTISVAYSPYGYRPIPAGFTKIGFTGQLLEPKQGNYLLGNGHRAYSPVLMRFLSSDRISPFGKGGINSYAYCNGDPINRHDRSGSMGHLALSGDVLNGVTFLAGVAAIIFSKYFNQFFTRKSIAAITLTTGGAASYVGGRIIETFDNVQQGEGFQMAGNYAMAVGTVLGTVDVGLSLYNARQQTVTRSSSHDGGSVNTRLSGSDSGGPFPLRSIPHGGVALVTSPVRKQNPVVASEHTGMLHNSDIENSYQDTVRIGEELRSQS